MFGVRGLGSTEPLASEELPKRLASDADGPAWQCLMASSLQNRNLCLICVYVKVGKLLKSTSLSKSRPEGFGDVWSSFYISEKDQRVVQRTHSLRIFAQERRSFDLRRSWKRDPRCRLGRTQNEGPGVSCRGGLFPVKTNKVLVFLREG